MDPDDDTTTAYDRARRLGDRLRDRGETVAAAESCTGGLLGAQFTAAPGSSDYFDRGLVTYAYDAKRAVLGVPREDLDAEGAVSEPVAVAMARGVRDRADVDWGLATTGIAGPTGGTAETPVGTVYVAVARAAEWGSGDSYATATRHEFDGGRAAVRRAAVEAALAALADAVDAA
jgi:nicotinamide-nucleotide amidase